MAEGARTGVPIEPHRVSYPRFLWRSLVEATDGIKTVPLDGELVQTGRALGISFGDEPG